MGSTADRDEDVEVSADGVTVRKWYAADEFPVPTIRFEIDTYREDPVAVRLAEDIPEEFPMDKVGFHPDYRSDDWTAFQDNHVEFTGTVSADDPIETVYGIRLDDEDDDVEAFLDEPTIVDVSTDGESEDDGTDVEEVDDDVIGNIVDDDPNEPVKDMIAGESETVPGLDDDEEAPDEGAEDLDLDLGDVDTEPVEEPDEEAAGEAPPDIDLGLEEEGAPDEDADDVSIDLEEDEATAAADAEATADGRVGARLAAEIRDDRIDDEDLAVLREELDLEPSGVDVAKVDHLQSRVETVAAYTDALESFLGEQGTGEQLIEEFREDLSSVEDDLAAVDGRLEGTESRVDGVEDDLEEVRETVDDVADDVESVEEELDDVEDDLEEVRTEVADIQDWREQLGSMFADT